MSFNNDIGRMKSQTLNSFQTSHSFYAMPEYIRGNWLCYNKGIFISYISHNNLWSFVSKDQATIVISQRLLFCGDWCVFVDSKSWCSIQRRMCVNTILHGEQNITEICTNIHSELYNLVRLVIVLFLQHQIYSKKYHMHRQVVCPSE